MIGPQRSFIKCKKIFDRRGIYKRKLVNKTLFKSDVLAFFVNNGIEIILKIIADRFSEYFPFLKSTQVSQINPYNKQTTLNYYPKAPWMSPFHFADFMMLQKYSKFQAYIGHGLWHFLKDY